MTINPAPFYTIPFIFVTIAFVSIKAENIIIVFDWVFFQVLLFYLKPKKGFKKEKRKEEWKKGIIRAFDVVIIFLYRPFYSASSLSSSLCTTSLRFYGWVA